MIELIGVTKEYGAITALHNANLQIKAGEFVLLSGPSGAGKTTLLRTLFAAVRPDEGRVVVDGQDITRLSRRAVPALRQSVGVVFQDFKLLSEQSALANVAVALEIRGLPPAQIRNRSQLALAAVGLEARAATRVSLLSGGEQQRVAIARALVGSPSLLLADEPTGNLDPERSHDILDLLALEAGRGTTIVVATHDPMVVQNAAAHRVVLMDGGQIVGTLSGANAAVHLPRHARPKSTPSRVLRPVEGTPEQAQQAAAEEVGGGGAGTLPPGCSGSEPARQQRVEGLADGAGGVGPKGRVPSRRRQVFEVTA